MAERNSDSIVKFVYSRPYEGTLLRFAGNEGSSKHHELGTRRAELVQEIWDEHEEHILDLFREMYKIDIHEAEIEAFISLILPGSFSHPLTISLLRRDEIETDKRQQRGVVYTVVHELAHYFAYTRDDETFLIGYLTK